MKTPGEIKEHQRHIADMVGYYARTASAYNTWHGDLEVGGPHNYAVSHLVNLVRMQNYRSVLDICCGTGRAVKICLENGIDAHGVDISQELINEGIRAWNLPADQFTRADATQLPFPDKHFDVSCVLGGLHHSAVPGRILEEMIRVTRHASLYPMKAITCTEAPRRSFRGWEFSPSFTASSSDELQERYEGRPCQQRMGQLTPSQQTRLSRW